MNESRPVVHLKVAQDADALRLQYEVRNTLREPIYVFDRLYDMRAQKLSAAWAYVAVDGQKATVSRQVWPLPNGLRYENPETPYGRLLTPNATATGQLSLTMPIAERDPYYSLSHRGEKPQTVQVSSLVFRMGWGFASQLHAGSPVELEGQRLVLFPFHEGLAKQQFADSESAQVNLAITVLR
ncbi:MAG TPA: hypothetical protein VLW46_00745 [Candidatus Bathyarchaeia archaeon]|nr:hypothetical protein [Candidatus Bathyarchaeia archaeon]